MNNLKPGLLKIEWTRDENNHLIELFSKYGPKWSLFCKYFNNRNQVSLKNRFLFLQKNHFISKEVKINAGHEKFIKKDNLSEENTLDEGKKQIANSNLIFNNMKNCEQNIEKNEEITSDKAIKSTDDVFKHYVPCFNNFFESDELNSLFNLNEDLNIWY